jgi:hypothetical protein
MENLIGNYKIDEAENNRDHFFRGFESGSFESEGIERITKWVNQGHVMFPEITEEEILKAEETAKTITSAAFWLEGTNWYSLLRNVVEYNRNVNLTEGTEKQIAWAEGIRSHFFNSLRDGKELEINIRKANRIAKKIGKTVDESGLMDIVAKARTINSAKWWIDNKSGNNALIAIINDKM